VREGCRAEAIRHRRAQPKISLTIILQYVIMKYVYILQSTEGDHFYVGVTEDLRTRIQKHNAGDVAHSSKYKPWNLKTYIAFTDEQKAFAFERYLKTASGRAFAKKRL
jgi:predicted GIY-YIG superfamily endonuclease